MSVRTDLAAALRTVLPAKSFEIKDEADLPDKLSKATVVVRSRGFAPAPNARGTMIATFIVTLATHLIDRTKAETALDLLLPQVLEALERHAGLTWSNATAVIVKETYLGFDIEASIPTATPY